MKQIILILLALLLVPTVAAECYLSVTALTTEDFIQEIPTINSQIQKCAPTLPSFITLLYSNAAFQVDVTPSSYFNAQITDKKLTQLASGQDTEADYIATISDEDFDLILQSDNGPSTALWLYDNDRITVEAQGVMNNVLLFLARPFLFFGSKRADAPGSISLSNQGTTAVGQECSSGQDCVTGNCIGVSGPPWIYKCSCSPFEYSTNC